MQYSVYNFNRFYVCHFYWQIFIHVEVVFPLLLDTLKHESDEVVIADLDVLAEVASTEVPAGWEDHI